MNVRDVTDATFDAEVIARSAAVPVLVDFWAPWCGPCKTLGPLLERLVEAEGGRIALAKVDVDQSPALASEFQVRSIPAVKVFVGGRLVDEFTGALPEREVRAFVRRWLPTEADGLADSGLVRESAGDAAGAATLYRRALEFDTNHPRARLGLGRVLESSDPEAALAELDRVLAGTPERHEADRIAARIRLGGAGGPAESELRARVAGSPNDAAARLALGRHLAAAGAHEEALGELLTSVKLDRNLEDAAARKAILDVFELLGARHPLVERCRGELAQVLFV